MEKIVFGVSVFTLVILFGCNSTRIYNQIFNVNLYIYGESSVTMSSFVLRAFCLTQFIIIIRDVSSKIFYTIKYCKLNCKIFYYSFNREYLVEFYSYSNAWHKIIRILLCVIYNTKYMHNTTVKCVLYIMEAVKI